MLLLFWRDHNIDAEGSSASSGIAEVARLLVMEGAGGSLSAAPLIESYLRRGISAQGSSASAGTAGAAQLYAIAAQGASTSAGMATAVQLYAAVAAGLSASEGAAHAIVPIRYVEADGLVVSEGEAAAALLLVAQAAGLSISWGEGQALVYRPARPMRPGMTVPEIYGPPKEKRDKTLTKITQAHPHGNQIPGEYAPRPARTTESDDGRYAPRGRRG